MYKNLLVPLDGSPTAQLALDEAAMLAHLSGATIHLLHVVDALQHITGFEPPAIHIADVRPRFLQAGQQLLDDAAAVLRAKGLTVQTKLMETAGARIAEVIADQAANGAADVIVLGTHGRRGVERLLIGSDAEQLARIAPVPVLLVRARRLG
jgi:nucleotide-binding universal stress UspA family protein